MANKNTQNNAVYSAPAMTPGLGFNEEKYAPYIADFKPSEDEQRELLQAVWTIMSAFADYGFGIEPTQLICGWMKENHGKAPLTGGNGVELKHKQTSRTFENASMVPFDPAVGKLEP